MSQSLSKNYLVCLSILRVTYLHRNLVNIHSQFLGFFTSFFACSHRGYVVPKPNLEFTVIVDRTYWRFQNLRSRHTFNKTPHILSDVTFQWRDKIPTGTPQEVDKSLKKHTGARNNFPSHFLDLIKNKNAILIIVYSMHEF